MLTNILESIIIDVFINPVSFVHAKKKKSVNDTFVIQFKLDFCLHLAIHGGGLSDFAVM